MTNLKTALITALVAGTFSAAQAADVNLTITESCNNSTETASAQWSSDPGAVITVTRDASRPDGEVWLIDLTASGHQVPGYPWPGGFTIATWTEPEHPGLWNNLYIDDPQHLHMESEWPVATGQNMGDYPNGFGNGVSYFAGFDVNGDRIFVRVVESPCTVATESATWGQIKRLY